MEFSAQSTREEGRTKICGTATKRSAAPLRAAAEAQGARRNFRFARAPRSGREDR
jgi:hypothetical protein